MPQNPQQETEMQKNKQSFPMAQDVGRDENLSPGSVPLTLKQYFHSLTNSGQRSVINLISRPSESIFSAPLLPSCPFLGRQPVILPSCSEESFSGRFINHLFYESQQHSAVIFAVYLRLVCKTKEKCLAAGGNAMQGVEKVLLLP